jgi:hypothetical protein
MGGAGLPIPTKFKEYRYAGEDGEIYIEDDVKFIEGVENFAEESIKRRKKPQRK